MARVRRKAAITMEGAPEFWANSMKIEAVETARIPPNRLKVRVERRGEGIEEVKVWRKGLGWKEQVSGAHAIVSEMLEKRAGILTFVKRSL